MRKSLGSKRKEPSDGHIAEITRLFGQFVETYEEELVVRKRNKPISHIFKNSDFGCRTITIERLLKDRSRTN